jgi:2-phospho-L-lactate guanylyltransferase
MTHPDACVIVPVKSFAGAKRRLAPLLSVAERAALARAMLSDVLAAAIAAVGPQRVMVVTSADEVADHARRAGAGIIDDEGVKGTNAAVKAGFARRRHGAVMALPGDIPGIIPADIAALFSAAERSRIALAPAPEDGGTNALACDAAGRIAPCFGPDSFARHIEAANAAGIRPAVLLNQRLGLDLDEPRHLMLFLDRATSTQTDAYLRSLGLQAREGWLARGCGPATIGRHDVAGCIEACG